MHSFFFCEIQLMTVLFLIDISYTSWSTWFSSLKLCLGFFIFDSILFLLNFVFWSIMDSLTLKRHNAFKIKIIEKPHTFLLSVLWFLGCNKKFEDSMIPTWVAAPQKLTLNNLFKLVKSKFWVRHFISKVSFK